MTYLCLGDLVGRSADELALLVHLDTHEDFTPDEPWDLEARVLTVRGERVETAWQGTDARALAGSPHRDLYVLAGERLDVGRHDGRRFRWEVAADGVTGLFEAVGAIFATFDGSLWRRSGGDAQWENLGDPGPARAVGADERGRLLAALDGAVAHLESGEWVSRPVGARTALDWVLPLGERQAVGATRRGAVLTFSEGEWRRARRRFGRVSGLVAWNGRAVLATSEGLFEMRESAPRAWRPDIVADGLRVGHELLAPRHSRLLTLTPEGTPRQRSYEGLLEGDWVAHPPWCALGQR